MIKLKYYICKLLLFCFTIFLISCSSFELTRKINSQEIASKVQNPELTGFIDGGSYDKPVIINYVDQKGINFTGSINSNTFKFGVPYEIEGSHTLIVTATHPITGEFKRKIFTFSISNLTPEVPTIVGVTEGASINTGVHITVNTVLGLTYEATIDNNPYILGNFYNKKGPHTLIVKATKKSTSRFSTKTIQFNII